MSTNGQLWIIYTNAAKKQTKPLTTLQMQKLLLSIKPRDLKHFFIWTPGWEEWKVLVEFLQSGQNYFVMTPIPKPPRRPGVKLPDSPTDILQDKVSEYSSKSDSFMDKDGDMDRNDNLFDPDVFVDSEHTEFTQVDAVEKKSEAPATQDYGYYSNDFRAEDIDVDAPVRMTSNSIESPKKAADFNRRSADRHEYQLEIVLISKSGKTFRSHSKNISMGGTMLEHEVPKDFLNSEFELMIINKFEGDKNKSRLYFQGKIVGDVRNPRRLTFKQANQQMMGKLETMLTSYQQQQKAFQDKKPGI